MKTQIKMVEIANIVASRTNPRKNFDKKQMEELTVSVREKGVLQPILLRPRPNWVGEGYEIVAGERRYRAALAAPLTQIPAMIQDLDDQSTMEIQVIENLHRSDVHPLEEAEGYELLLKQKGYSDIDDLVIKIGKSKSYIYGRMKLCALLPKARKAFYDGDLTPSTALLIARIPAAIQLEALNDITEGNQPMSYQDAMEHIHRTYTLKLSDAPFNTKDETLIPAAGNCLTCPKRTGNQNVLFADIKNADVCTDTKCFHQKKGIFNKRIIDEAQKKGLPIMPAEASKKLTYSYEVERAGYVDLSKTDWRIDGKKNIGTILKKDPNFKPMLAIDGNGDLLYLGKKVDVEDRLKKMGLIKRSSTSASADEKKRKEENIIKRNVGAQIMELIVEAVLKDEHQIFWINLANACVEHIDHETQNTILKRRQWQSKPGETRSEMSNMIKTLSPLDCRALIIEMMVYPTYWSYGQNEENMVEFCELYKININKIRADAKAKAIAKKESKNKKGKK